MDWRVALAQLCEDVTARDASQLIDLGRACELIDVDRRRAFAMYRAAWDRQPEATTIDG